MTVNTPTGQLVVNRQGGILRLTISNQAHRNAMTLPMWAALAKQIQRADQDDSIRVIVIEGDGHLSFSAGADISEFTTLRATSEQVAHYDQTVNAVHQALGHCQRPTVAVI